MDDFRKYATKHLGMNSMVLDDVHQVARVSESLHFGGASVECDSVGCVFPTDDGPGIIFLGTQS